MKYSKIPNLLAPLALAVMLLTVVVPANGQISYSYPYEEESISEPGSSAFQSTCFTVGEIFLTSGACILTYELGSGIAGEEVSWAIVGGSSGAVLLSLVMLGVGMDNTLALEPPRLLRQTVPKGFLRDNLRPVQLGSTMRGLELRF